MSGHSRVFEDGYDWAMVDIGRLILGMWRQGASDDDVLDAVLDLIELRMVAGLDDAVDELAGE